MIELKYDTPVEVSEKKYRELMNRCGGLIAGRQENGKFYIKLWMVKYKNDVEFVLNLP
jgi:hypothetical protein